MSAIERRANRAPSLLTAQSNKSMGAAERASSVAILALPKGPSMKRTVSIALATSLVALTVPTVSSGQPATDPAAGQMKLTDKEAAAAADAAQVAWTSMDAAKIDSVYAP